jgi:hypothetical protein
MRDLFCKMSEVCFERDRHGYMNLVFRFSALYVSYSLCMFLDVLQ